MLVAAPGAIPGLAGGAESWFLWPASSGLFLALASVALLPRSGLDWPFSACDFLVVYQGAGIWDLPSRWAPESLGWGWVGRGREF